MPTHPRLCTALILALACSGDPLAARDEPPGGLAPLDPREVWRPSRFDTLGPAISITFPPAGSYTSSDAVLLRGTAHDDGAVEDLVVDGIAGLVGGDGTWTLEVPLEPGVNTLQVTATDPGGHVATASVDIVRSWHLAETRDVAWDAARSVAWVLDRRQDALIGLDPASGYAWIASDRSHGGGLDLLSPIGLLLDGDRALVTDDVWDAVVEIDLVTGDRTVISDHDHGAGPALSQPAGMAWSGGEIAVVDGTRVLFVDPDTGTRRLGSGAGVGAGDELGGAVSIAVEGSVGWVVDSAADAIVEIDLATGDRRVVSSDLIGAGPEYAVPNDLHLLDPSTAWVTDNGLDAVLRVDLTTGDRTVWSGEGVGTGPAYRWPRGVAEGPDGTVLVVDSELGAFFVVDEAGNRTLPELTRAGSPRTHRQPQQLVLEGGTAWVVDDLRDALIRFVPGEETTVVSDVDHGAGEALVRPVSLATHEGAWWVLDPGLGALVQVDPATGDRTAVSSATVGQGPLLDDGIAVAVQGRRSFVVLGGAEPAVVEIDLATGDRRLWSGRGLGAGPTLGAPSGLLLEGGTLVVSDLSGASGKGIGGRLIGVDPDSGDRHLISELELAGLGAPFVDPRAPTVAPDGHLLVSDGGLPGILRVDPETGDRTVVSDVGVGGGPWMRTPVGAWVHPETGHLVVADRGVAALFWVDAVTGERVAVLR